MIVGVQRTVHALIQFTDLNLPFKGQAYLFQPVKVVFVDLELEAFLEASSLWHLYIHGTHILLVLILPFLS